MNLCFAEICHQRQPLSKVLKMLDPPYDVYMSTRDKKRLIFIITSMQL